MPRPKGSKNKKTVSVSIQENVEDKIAAVEAEIAELGTQLSPGYLSAKKQRGVPTIRDMELYTFVLTIYCIYRCIDIAPNKTSSEIRIGFL